MAKALESFTATPTEDGYLIRMEDEDGDALEVVASFDQLDLIVEEIDQYLDVVEEDELAVEEDENLPNA